ncbi:MAG TPA: hypothetical protein VJK52_01085, partial [Candidatus Nanoarchaeia archaeon]|nr:hypothetical protein [Candidatus Nanoarchaeia archaeon]
VQQFHRWYLHQKLPTIDIARAHYFVARQNQLYGDFDAALAEFAAQVAEYPFSDRAQRSLLFSGVILCRDKQQYDQGIDLLQRALNVSDDLTASDHVVDWRAVENFYLGRCYESKGEPEKAMPHFAEAAKASIRDAAYRYVNYTTMHS